MRKCMALLLAAALMLTLAACGSAESAKNEKYKIVVVPKDATDPSALRMEQGVLEYAEDHPEVNVYQSGIDKYDPLKQSQLVEDLVAQRVDAICLVPIDLELLEPILKKAQEVGIVVITNQGADLTHRNYDIETSADEDPAVTAKVMITLAVKVLQQETISAPVDLGEPGFSAMQFREGSSTILEGAG